MEDAARMYIRSDTSNRPIVGCDLGLHATMCDKHHRGWHASTFRTLDVTRDRFERVYGMAYYHRLLPSTTGPLRRMCILSGISSLPIADCDSGFRATMCGTHHHE